MPYGGHNVVAQGSHEEPKDHERSNGDKILAGVFMDDAVADRSSPCAEEAQVDAGANKAYGKLDASDGKRVATRHSDEDECGDRRYGEPVSHSRRH